MSIQGVGEIKAELDNYRQSKPGLVAIIDLNAKIVDISREVRLQAAPLGLSPEQALCQLKSAQSILSDLKLPFDSTLFRATAEKLAVLFGAASGQSFPAGAILDLPSVSQGNYSDLLTDTEALGAIAVKSAFNLDTIAYFIFQLLRPFYTAAVEPYRQLPSKIDWHYNFCPLCGSGPAYAVITAANRRELYCALCGGRWHFNRLACPCCASSDAKQLRQFHLGDDQAHRVDLCDNCRHYIKTTDERLLGGICLPEVEIVVTTDLDQEAQRLGFAPIA